MIFNYLGKFKLQLLIFDGTDTNLFNAWFLMTNKMSNSNKCEIYYLLYGLKIYQAKCDLTKSVNLSLVTI